MSNDREEAVVVTLPRKVLYEKKLSPIDRVVYFELCTQADRHTHQCSPSIREIVRNIGISERSVKRSITRLVKLGYIDRVFRKDESGGNTTSLYTVYHDTPSHKRTVRTLPRRVRQWLTR